MLLVFIDKSPGAVICWAIAVYWECQAMDQELNLESSSHELVTKLKQRFSHSRLGSLGIHFPFFVGPMVGLTHVAMRELIRHYTPEQLQPLLFTEMLSTLRLPSERLDRADELKTGPYEKGLLIPQLLGNDEWYIERSIQRLSPIEPFGYDINMGCPVKKTLRHNWGVRLMGDADYAGRVVRVTKKHSQIPVSVKMRCGLHESDVDFVSRFTDTLEQNGLDWLTIHARSKEQKHKGSADWEAVGRVRARRSIPVVLNGDVQTANDAIRAISEYGVDGVMIGRAATARPWILWQIADELGLGLTPKAFAPGTKPPCTAEQEGAFYLDSLLLFIDLLQRYATNQTKMLKRFKFYLITSQKWLFYGHSFYGRCMKCKDLEQVKAFIEDFRRDLVFPMTGRITLH